MVRISCEQSFKRKLSGGVFVVRPAWWWKDPCEPNWWCHEGARPGAENLLKDPFPILLIRTRRKARWRSLWSSTEPTTGSPSRFSSPSCRWSCNDFKQELIYSFYSLLGALLWYLMNIFRQYVPAGPPILVMTSLKASGTLTRWKLYRKLWYLK